MDKDLLSIQEVRDKMKLAKRAQETFSAYSQEQVDGLLEQVVERCAQNAEKLAKMAEEETGFGRWQDKVVKNRLASTILWKSICSMKTIGVLREDTAQKVTEIAVPVGVVAALIPSTNPTSTTIYKSIISLKAGNAVMISPHPNAKKCIMETVDLLRTVLRENGAPEDLVQVISVPTIQATNTLMSHPDTGLILATGGTAMVKAAYSSGTPALGVGPGNGPSFIEHSADIPQAVERIIISKTFDNGTICASEQSIVTEECIRTQVLDELQKQGACILNEEQSEKLSRFIMRANNTMNPAIVGKSAMKIAEIAGIHVPEGTKVLVSPQTEVSFKNPYSREKLCPILAFYTAPGWESACDICMSILHVEGTGHTMTMHTQNEKLVREFALKKPVSRLLVNTSGSLGGVGATTGLAPALTLGCGAAGGSATSDNITPLNLLNIRRVAYGLVEPAELGVEKQSCTTRHPPVARSQQGDGAVAISRSELERITREVLSSLIH